MAAAMARFDRSLARVAVLAALVAGVTVTARAQQRPIAGPNINMVRGTKEFVGDPYLQRQNEPTIAVSSRNPCHLFAGANDYRTVDIPDTGLLPNDLTSVPAAPAGPAPKDAWLGWFKSFDCGASWRSGLVPGYPQDGSAQGLASPLKGLAAGADSTVRSGTNGLFFYSGMVFNRGDNGASRIFISRYIDDNNNERGDTIRYLGAITIETGTKGQFSDKPWLAVDIPRNGYGPAALPWTVSDAGDHQNGNSTAKDGNGYCDIPADPANGVPAQHFAAGNVYMAWTRFDGNGTPNPSKIMFARSNDCGVSWNTRPISNNQKTSQGAAIAIAPSDGTVYVAWREFGKLSRDHAIWITRSTDGGKTFEKPRAVATPINPYDQTKSETRFRTNTLPTIAVDHLGRVYVAWAERGYATSSGRLDPITGDARIVLAVSTNGGNTFKTRYPIADRKPTGSHQIMPALRFTAGQLQMLFYDFADDVARSPAQYVDDAGNTIRHTVDVAAATASPSDHPVFQDVLVTPEGTNPKISEYRTLKNNVTGKLEQAQWNPPNLPLYVDGSTPFLGDYIDIGGLDFIPIRQGTTDVWQPNLGAINFTGGSIQGSSSTSFPLLPVFHATWTDHRDVKPPLDGNWKNYVPPGQGGAFCEPAKAGMRNANIYTSRLTTGLYVGSPGNTKPLGFTTIKGQVQHIQRGFVVFLQNTTKDKAPKRFLVHIANQPGTVFGDRASFLQDPRPPYVPGTVLPSPQTWRIVSVPPLSTVARTVYVTATNPNAQVRVEVAEIAASTPVSALLEGSESELATLGPALAVNGLRTSVLLNPDATNPPITDPDFVSDTLPSVTGQEEHDPAIFDPLVTSINNVKTSLLEIRTPDEGNPDEGNQVETPDEGNPDEGNPDEGNPDEGNPDEGNTGLLNTALGAEGDANPNFATTSITDVQWKVSSKGNTTSAFKFRPTFKGSRTGKRFQLFVTRRYYVPAIDPITCDLIVHRSNQVLVNVADYKPRNPDEGNPDEGNPDEGNPDEGNPDEGNATFMLAPGETATVTLRVYDTTTPEPAPAVVQEIRRQSAGLMTALATDTTEAKPSSAASGSDLVILNTLATDNPGTPRLSQGAIAPGGTLTLFWTLKNRGTAATLASESPFNNRFVLRDTSGVAPDRDLAVTPFTGVVAFDNPATPAIEGEVDLTQSLTIPRNVPPANYVIVIVADSGHTVLEADDFNNLESVPVSVGFTLTFGQQPSQTTQDFTMTPAPAVLVLDGVGAPVGAAEVSSVTLALSGGVATLGGTLTRANVGGVATFNDLHVDNVGSNYRLNASASGSFATASNLFTITVDSPPVSQGDSYQADEGQTLTTGSGDGTPSGTLNNDSDEITTGPGQPPAGRQLTAVLVTGPAHAASFALQSNGNFAYTPANNYTGPDSFTYRANDARSDGNTVTVSITVGDFNDPPSGLNDSLSSVAEDSGARSISFASLLANDSAGPNESSQVLTITAASSAIGGTVSLSGTNVVFTPAANYNGPASFVYTLQDNGTTGGAPDFRIATAAASFTITEVNDAPAGTADALSSVPPNSGPRTISFASLLANDVAGPANESAQLLTITAVANAVGGTVSINGTDVIFTPLTEYNGPASFDYTLRDNGTTAGANAFLTATASVSFTITASASNSPPTANNDAKSTNEDVQLAFPASDLVANDSDDSAQHLLVTAVAINNPAPAIALAIGPSASAFTGPAACRSGFVPPQCTAQPYDTTQNLAFGKPVVASSTLGGFPAIHAAGFINDGFYGHGSSWINDNAPNSFITIDLGQPFWITHVSFGRDRTGGFDDRDPGQFTISTSLDNAVFTTPFGSAANGFTGNINGADTVDARLTPVRARWIRLTVAAASAAIDEIEVFGSAGLPTTATQGDVTLAGGQIVFTPLPNFNGTTDLLYTVCDDGVPVLCADAAVAVAVAAVNDAPAGTNDVLSSVPEDSGPRTISFAALLNNDSTGPADESGQALIITAVGNAAGGSVRIVGTDVEFTPLPDYNGPASFVYTLQDNGTTGGAPDFKTATATASFSITEVNDAPAGVNDGLTSVSEDSGARTISFASLLANDSAGPLNESGQTLTIIAVGTAVGGSVTISGTDVLFTPSADYAGPASFVYTVRDNGTTSGVNDFKTATATASFTITAGNDAPTGVNDLLSSVPEDSGARTISFASLLANDSAGPVNESGQILTITAVGSAVGGSVTISGTDVRFTTSPDYNGPASFVYTLQDNGTTGGAPDFKTATATASFTITEDNDAPAGVNDPLSSMSEDSGARTISFASLLTNDSAGPANESGQTLTIIAVGSAVGGSVTISGTDVLFTPAADYSGPASFVYTLRDNGTTAGANDFKTATATASFTITVANDAPTGTNDVLSNVAEDSAPRTISFATLLNNDSAGPADESGQALTITAVGSAVGGSVSIVGTDVLFTPLADYNGPASFVYTLQDNGTTGGAPDFKTATATASFPITEVNDAPTGVNDSLGSVPENSAVRTISFAILLANDSAGPANESGQTLTITAVGSAVGGSVTISGTDVLFTPAADYAGPASFVYTLRDNGTTAGANDFKTATATASFTITAANSAPVANAQSVSTPEDIPVSITLTATDPENDPLTYTIVASPANGTLTGTPPNLNYMPFPNYNGPDAFTFQASDNPGVDSIPGLVSRWPFDGTAVDTTGGNSPFATAALGYVAGRVDRAVTLGTGGFIDVADAANLRLQTLTASAWVRPQGPNTTADQFGDNIFSKWTLNGGAPGSVALTWRASDGRFVLVVGQASATVISTNGFPAGGFYHVAATYDGAVARLYVNGQPQGQTPLVTVIPYDSQKWVIGSSAFRGGSFDRKWNGAIDDLRIYSRALTGAEIGQLASQAVSNVATVAIGVTAVNDAPTGVNDGLTSVSEDSGVRTISFASLLANDSAGPANESGQTLTITAVGNAVGGSVSIVGTNVLFTPTPDHNGPASFVYTLQDNGTTGGAPDFKTATATASFTITEVNDAPTGVNDGLTSVAEDSGVRTITFASLLANDSTGPANESGQTLTITAVASPVGGSVTISGTDVLFTPAADYSGPASFVYTLRDNGTTAGVSDFKTATATASFTITAVNDAPIGTNDVLSNVAEDSGARTITFASLLANDSAGPANEISQILTIIAVASPVGGSVAISGTNVLFTPAADYSGPASFVYTLRDNGTTAAVTDFKTATATASFTITEVNDAPTGVNDGLTSMSEDSGVRTISFASLLANDSAGPANESGQTLTITAVASPVGGSVTISGTDVLFTPAADYSGPASFVYTLRDNGTTAGVGDFKTATATASFTITAANDAPTGTNDVLSNVAEDSGPRSISFTSLLNNDSTGPGNESGQALTITAVGNAVGGSVSIVGTNVLFTPTHDYNGPASFVYTLQDNGTTGGAPDFKTATATASFTITAVNDAPSFTRGADQAVAQNSLTHTVSEWASNIDAGAPNESGQTVTFLVSSDNAALFSTPPTVSSDGTLSFTPAPGTTGSANVTVRAKDDGGIANGGVDTSAPQSFTITVTGTPQPTIASLRPRIIDSFHPPTVIRVTGTNLTGASFTFVSEGASIVTAGAAQIDPSGTSAVLSISTTFGSLGSAWLVATNALGSSDESATAANTLTVINLAPTGDLDGDGLTNEYELAIETSTANADSDGDGLPDGYEVRYRLNPLAADATTDADDDGRTNFEEFTAGTDPRNAHNVPPAVVETFPAEGAVGYPINGVYIARFSEPLRVALSANVARAAIDAAVPLPIQVPADLSAAAQMLTTYMRAHGEGDSVVPGTIRLFRDGTEVAGAVKLSSDRLSVTFTPASMLATNTLFTSSIDGPRDDAGTLMSAPFHSTFTTGATADTTAPMIVRTNPPNGGSGVPVNAAITLQFNKRIDPATLTLQNFYLYDNTTGQTPAGMVQVDPNGLTASFVPDQPWAVGRTISVYPSQAIRDTAGNQISYYGFSFSTGFSSDHDGPSVIGHNPRDGAFDVPLNTQIMVQFNESLNPISAAAGVQLYSGGVGVPGSVALSDGNRRMTFTPAASLAPNTTFTIEPNAGVTDVAGNAAVALTSSTFTTGTQTDSQTPVVTATTPVNGASGVPTNAVMRWMFNEPINPLSINAGTLIAYPSATGIPIAAAYQLSSDGRTATLTPAAPLSPSTNYTFYTYGATDLAGNLGYLFGSFTTGSGAQVAGPMVSVLSPANNTTSVPLNARIVAVMSSALNPNSVTASAITLTANSIAVAGSLSMSGDRTITFTPAAPLAAATQYTVNIAALSDVAGNLGEPATSSFVTGTAASTQAPALTSIVPAYTSIDVPVGSSFVATFDTPVDPTSININTMTLSVPGIGSAIAATYQVTGNTVTLTPLVPLPGNTLVYLQIYGVQNLAGVCCNYYYNSFRTEAVADTTAPHVVAVTPVDGSTGIGLNAGIVITFSESLNSQTVNNNSVALFANGGRFGGYAGISSDYRSVFLSGGQLPAGSVVTVMATSDITDISGNHLADFSSSFTTAQFFDTSHPYVVSSRPGNGASGVALDLPIVLFLNDPIDPESAPGALHVSQNGVVVEGAVTVTGNGMVVTFTPQAQWAPNAFIQVFFDAAAHDPSGNSITAYQTSFRTAENPLTALPTAVAITPAYAQSDVPANTMITLAFNVALDPDSLAGRLRLTGPGGVVATNVTLDPTGKVVRIVPSAPLLSNNYYTVEAFAGIASVTGALSQNSGSWYFFTGLPADNTAPVVLSVTPPHGAVNVGDNAGIVLRFNEPINTHTITNVGIGSALGSIPYSASFANGNRTVYLTPYQALPDGEEVTVTINGVTDLAGNAATFPATRFTVASGPDVTPPMVVATNPANGRNDVATTTFFELRVNEPIDPATVHSGTWPIYDNVLSQQINGTYSVSSDGRTVHFAPFASLAVYRSHSVYFTYYGITDVSGNLIGPGGGLSSFSFTTGARSEGAGPQVTGLSPADEMTGVPRNTQIVIDFDRPIAIVTADRITLSLNDSAVATTRTFGNGDARVYLTPINPLLGSEVYALSINGVEDLTGVEGDVSVTTFTTAPGADLIAPAITMVSPAQGQSGVPTNAMMQVQFNERIDPLTVHGGTFQIAPQPTGIPIPGSYTVSADGRTATFVPSVALLPTTGYYFNVNGISDLVGQTVYSFTSFTTGYGPRTTGPSVIALSPADGTTNVALNARVTAYFDEPLVPDSIGPGSIRLEDGSDQVTGIVLLAGDRRSLTFTPSSPLSPSTTYDVEITGASDTAGNPLDLVTSSFSTGTSTVASFSLVSVTPAFSSEIPVSSTFHLTFNSVVDSASVSGGILLYVATGNLSATYDVVGNTVTVTPTTALPGNTTVYMQVYGLRDAAGNAVNYVNGSWHTEAVADTTAPTVVAFTPSSDTTGVGLTAPISITFSESLNGSTVNNNTVGLFANGSRLGGYAGISSDYRTIFMSGGTLPANTLITIATTSGITDVSGNPAADYTSSFTTGPGFDLSLPFVVSQRPGNGASGVALDTPIVLFMNEPLDPSSVSAAFQVSQNGVLIEGAVQVSPNGQTLTFRPSAPWEPSAFIQVFLFNSARDVTGNPAVAYQASFRTGADETTAVPMVVATSPNYYQGDAPANTVVRIAFNVPIDPASLPGRLRLSNQFGVAEPSTISLDGTARVVTLAPIAASLVANAYYYVDTQPGIRSVSGVTQNNSASWYFYTGAAADLTTPQVRSVTPPHGAVNVGDNARIIVRFNEPIDPLSVTLSSIEVSSAVGPVVSSISFGNGNRDVYLTPTAPLPAGQVVNVTITGVTDLANHSVTSISTQFAVGDGADTAYPMVVATNPVSGLTNVPLNVTIALRVNEPVDPSTVHAGAFPVYDNFVGVQVPGTYTVSSDGKTVSFSPTNSLAANRSHSVYFSYYGITDTAGNIIGPGGLGSFSFTTGSTSNATDPQVVAVTPADQLTGVARNVRVVVDFDRAIDTLTANLIDLSANGQPVPAIIGFANGDARVVLTPYNLLAPSTLYTLTIGGVRDLSGHALATPLVRHFTTAAGVDVVAPSVTVVSPANGAGNVPTNLLVQAGFSERIDPLTINSASFTVTPQATGIPIAASYLVAADGRSATLVPASPLTPLSGYYLQLYGVTDLVGQTVYSFTSFTTGAGPQMTPPSVVTVSPPDGAAGVPTNAKVSVLLSAPISPVTIGSDALVVKANGSPVSGSSVLSGDRQTITFTPSSSLTPSTTFTVTAGGFADMSGNTAVPFTSQFTTGLGGEDAGPLTVTSLTPSHGATEVAVNTSIAVTFNKAINPLSVNASSFLVNYPGVSSVSGTFTVNGATASFTPAIPLPGNTSVFVQISGVQDLSGVPNSYASATFHTAAVADSTMPTVLSVTPGDGATDVGLNTPVVITFSESLNPATVNGSTFALFANGSRFGYIAAISADSRTVTMNGGTLPASSLISLEITSGVQDLASNSLSDFTATFLTTAAFDTTRPSIVGQRPGNGATAVAPALPILLFVNERLDAGTVTGAVQVTQNGLVVAGDVELIGNGQVVRFTPAAPWAFNAVIQVFMDASAKDLNGNGVNGYSASFRTATDPAMTAPVVAATTPVSGTSNVPINTIITLGYNVPLDPNSVNSSTVTISGPSGAVAAAIDLDSTQQVIRIAPSQALAENAFFYIQTTSEVRGANGLAQISPGAWYFYTGTATDDTAPSVTAVTPPNGSSGVGDNARIAIRFSEPINPQTVNATTIAIASPLGAIETSVSLGNGNREVYLTPNRILPDGASVSITISGVTDAAGNAVAGTATQFSVGAGPDLVSPIVTSTNPVSGLTGVPTNAVIALRFNEPIDPATVHGGTFLIYESATGQQVLGTYSVAADARTASFVPATTLGVNRSYSVYFFGYGITDLSGNVTGYAGGYNNFSFVTGSTADTSGPTVRAISPADLLTGVPRNAQVMIDFDRAIDALSAGQIALLRGGAPVAATVSFGNGDSRVTLTPNVPLQSGTVYVVQIGAVTDLGGNPLATPVSSSFTTGSSVDLTAPLITSVSPANGATGVSVTAAVVLTFNERMNPLSINPATLTLVEYNTGIRVAAEVVVAADGRSAGIAPTAPPLKPDTFYYVSASGLVDLAGQQVGLFSVFRTAP